MRIGIDIDGVLADYVEHMRTVATTQGIKVDPLGGPRTYSMVEPGWFTDDHQWARCHEIVTGELERTPLLDAFAPEALARLRSRGHHLVVMTARRAPTGAGYSQADVVQATQAWLERHRIQAHEVVFNDHRTPRHELELDLALDDSPEQIAALHAAGVPTVIRDQPYNRHLSQARIVDMRDFLRLTTRV